MPPDLALRGDPGRAARWSPAWQRGLLYLAACWGALFVLFWRDWADMAGQWWLSSTYTHILLIPAILIWLVWQRAGQLVLLVPRGWWPGLSWFVAAGLIWLMGATSGVNLARHVGAVGMLQGSVIALLGPRVSRGLAFPLSYSAFLVPFGDEMVESLQMITAKLTIGMMHLSGIPARIDGVFIDTPAGLFEVAEACSGVKFLIAMIALGVLVAHVGFRSHGRRAIFLVAAIILPILANGVRAWGTIWIAQSRGAGFAAGFDHIIYGWVFFASLMTVLIGIAWQFFDRAIDGPSFDGDALVGAARQDGERDPVAPRLLALTLIGIGAALVLWAGAANRLAAPVPDQIFLPDVAGWTRINYAPRVAWSPRAAGADHRLLGSYRDGRGHVVDVFAALYARQNDRAEAGGFGQGALTQGSAWAWLGDGPRFGRARSDWLLAPGGVKRLAATWYRAGDTLTGSTSVLKLALMRDRIGLRATPTMLLIVSAEDRPGRPAAEAIAAFGPAAGPVRAWMDRIGPLG